MSQDLFRVSSRSPIVKGILDYIPCAVAIWADNASKGLLNYRAMQLVGVAESNLPHEAWMSRIDPSDRGRFRSAWTSLSNQDEIVSSDYRFLTGDGRSIWLRDISAPYHNASGDLEAIISTYTEISDLKTVTADRRKISKTISVEEIIGPVIHEIRNNLHAIRLEMDIVLMDLGAALSSDRFLEAIDRVNRSLHDLREFLVSPEPKPSAANPKLILDNILQHMKQELECQGIAVELSQCETFPMVWIDSKQFRNALERVLEFCRALLEKGGRLEIQTALKKLETGDHVELTLTASSASSLEVDEKDIFRPFLRVNNRQIGLSMALASQILRRNKGDITFIKESPARGQISILLTPCAQ